METVTQHFIRQLAQQLQKGDETALNEIRRLKGQHAANLLDELRNDREAYRKAATVILREYGR